MHGLVYVWVYGIEVVFLNCSNFRNKDMTKLIVILWMSRRPLYVSTDSSSQIDQRDTDQSVENYEPI